MQGQHKGKGARRTRNTPFTTPCPSRSLFECCSYEAASFESNKRGGKYCNLRPKEGSSLFAMLAKRQRKTLPKSLHLHAKLCISFWPRGWQFRKHPREVNQKCVKGGKTQPCRWSWPHDGRSPRTVRSVSRMTPPTTGQCSMFLSPSSSSQGPRTAICLVCFSFKVTTNFAYLFTSR